MYNPPLYNMKTGLGPAFTLEIGREYVGPTGYIFGLGLGGGYVYDPEAEKGQNVFEPYPFLNVRIGKQIKL